MARKIIVGVRMNAQEHAPLAALAVEKEISEAELARELIKYALKSGKV